MTTRVTRSVSPAPYARETEEPVFGGPGRMPRRVTPRGHLATASGRQGELYEQKTADAQRQQSPAGDHMAPSDLWKLLIVKSLS